jgi:hypothetical protein
MVERGQVTRHHRDPVTAGASACARPPAAAVPGRVVRGEPAFDSGLRGLGPDHAMCPTWSSSARRSPGPRQDRRRPGPAALRSGMDRSAGPAIERSDCMIWNVVVVNASMSAAASSRCTRDDGRATLSVTVSRWALTPALAFSPVPGAQLVRVIDDQDAETAGRRGLGQHIADHGLAVELRRRGQGFGRRRSRPDRARQREPGQLCVALARPLGHEGDPVVLARPAHACSSDVFPPSAGAKMIITASRPRDPAWRPGRDGRPLHGRACRGTSQWPACRS